MSGFDKLVKESRDAWNAFGDGSPFSGYKEIFTLPSFLTWSREMYVQLGPLKRPFKTRMRSFVDECNENRLTTDFPRDEALETLIKHVIAKVRVHSSSSDVEIRRWATTCQELFDHPQAVECLLHILFRADKSLQDFVSMSLNGMMSECISRNHPVMPL